MLRTKQKFVNTFLAKTVFVQKQSAATVDPLLWAQVVCDSRDRQIRSTLHAARPRPIQNKEPTPLILSRKVASAEEDLAAAVNKYTDHKGAELIFDPVAGSFLETLAQCAASGAQIIEYGWLSGEPTPFPLFPAFQKALTVRGYTLYEFVNDPVLRPQAERFVNDHLAQGKLHPKIDRTFPLAQVVEAHRYLESNQQVGKVVVTVDE